MVDIRKRMAGMFVVILVILLASIAMIIGIHQKEKRKSYQKANIYQDGEFLMEVDLSRDQEFQIDWNEGDGFNVILVKDGKIGVIESSCKDHVCEHMGMIRDSKMPIVCLPNHLMIEVVTDETSSTEEIDGVAY